jgi:DNA-binding IclR family transcriptional regulator
MAGMAKDATKASRYRAPALEKGLDILEILADASLPLSQVELAQKLRRSQGEFFRMLMCLEERGYVIRESESGHYKLTLRLYELGHKQNSTNLLRNAARIPMERLSEEIGQACHLSVQSDSSLLILMERMPSRRICLAVGEGTTFPLIETISGKLLLSQTSPEEVNAFGIRDDVFRAKSPRERKAILSEIEQFRPMPHVIAESQLTEGVTDIATIVGVPRTDTLAALVIPYLSTANQKKKDNTRYLKALQQCADEINRNLGIVG